MERKKEKIILCSIFLIINFVPAKAQSIDSIRIQEIFKLFSASKFIVKKTVSKIDSFYGIYRKIKDESFCIANPGVKFNSTDLKEMKYCNVRLVVYGTSSTDHFLKVILYEEDHGGGIGKTCDIYEVTDHKISNLVSFFVPPKTKTIWDIKHAISNKKCTIVDYYKTE